MHAPATYVVRVSPGYVHLPQSVVGECVARSCKLGGLVVVLEGLVVVTLCVCVGGWVGGCVGVGVWVWVCGWVWVSSGW